MHDVNVPVSQPSRECVKPIAKLALIPDQVVFRRPDVDEDRQRVAQWSATHLVQIVEVAPRCGHRSIELECKRRTVVFTNWSAGFLSGCVENDVRPLVRVMAGYRFLVLHFQDKGGFQKTTPVEGCLKGAVQTSLISPLTPVEARRLDSLEGFDQSFQNRLAQVQAPGGVMVPPDRIERSACALGKRRSIQLSYGGMSTLPRLYPSHVLRQREVRANGSIARPVRGANERFVLFDNQESDKLRLGWRGVHSARRGRGRTRGPVRAGARRNRLVTDRPCHGGPQRGRIRKASPGPDLAAPVLHPFPISLSLFPSTPPTREPRADSPLRAMVHRVGERQLRRSNGGPSGHTKAARSPLAQAPKGSGIARGPEGDERAGNGPEGCLLHGVLRRFPAHPVIAYFLSDPWTCDFRREIQSR